MNHRSIALASASLALVLAPALSGCASPDPSPAKGSHLGQSRSALEKAADDEATDDEVYGGPDAWYSQGEVVVTSHGSGGGDPGGGSGFSGYSGGDVYGGSDAWYSQGNVTVTGGGSSSSGGGTTGEGRSGHVPVDDDGDPLPKPPPRKYSCYCSPRGSAGGSACVAATAWEQVYASGAAASADAVSACATFGYGGGTCSTSSWEDTKLASGCPTCAPSPLFGPLGASGQFVWLGNGDNVSHFIAQYNDADAQTLFGQLKNVASFYSSGDLMNAVNAFIGAVLPKEVALSLETLEDGYAAGTDTFALNYAKYGAHGGLIVLVDENTDSALNVGGEDSLVKLTYRIYLRTNKVQIGEYHVDTWFDGAGARVGELHHLPRDYRADAPPPAPCSP